MLKKGYNWKARLVKDVQVDESATKQINVDIAHRTENYDSSNALVLPSEKRKIKYIQKHAVVPKLLSKKQRKRLEKVIERKEKKSQRSKLLDELKNVQVTKDELNQYVSLQALQTRGLKRHFQELESPTENVSKGEAKNDNNNGTEPTINAIRITKKRRYTILYSEKTRQTSSDPNVVGFEDSNDSDTENEENKEELEEETESDNMEDMQDCTSAISSEKEAKENSEAEKTQKKSIPDANSIENKNEQAESASIPLISSSNDVSTKKKDRNNSKTTLEKTNEEERTAAIFVSVNRKPEIQAARLKLPVVAEEQVIIETINENPVVIITGETGSGKTTQVPQFLYEAGYAREKLIGVTEPRRVAAMSMSKRVAEEMNLTEKEVSYLIRFEGNVTLDTKIKFMTDGVLFKEIQHDFLLKKYSVIILDEAHERSVHTDILIGLLSRIVALRNKRNDPLKLVIMSATLRIEEFVNNRRLFKIKPPVISVESRQFPVTVHFNKRTSQNYVSDALRKAAKIHTQLPEGGILIFLTGQQEVNMVVRKLRKAFPLKNNIKSGKNKNINEKLSKKQNDKKKGANVIVTETNENENNVDSEEEFDITRAIRRNKEKHKKQQKLPAINLDNYSIVPTDDTHEDLIVDGDEEGDIDEDEDDDFYDLVGWSNMQPLWVLPLYSLLPSYKQARVFETPPEGTRLCVVSTNIAETSLTIPNIKYVIDSGRCKMKIYDKVTGVNTYRVSYISKAAANQRAGRAGRTGPGHCYRLYSSAVFNDQFEAHSQSEIQRKPIDDLLLQMKVMNIDKVVNFPFPTPPDIEQLKSAEKRLITLGALQAPAAFEKDKYNATVTKLGYSIAAFPVAPRYGKMLALSHQHDLLAYTVCMVAALSVQEVLLDVHGVEGATKRKWLETRRAWAGVGNSLLLGDPMVLIKAVCAAEYARFKGKLNEFCDENGLRHKAIIEIGKLRRQLTNEINLNIPEINLTIDPKMPTLTDTHMKLLRQIVLAGMIDHVARKVSSEDIREDQDKIKWKTKWKHAYKTLEMEDPVYMHSTCVLRKLDPQWVVYQEIYETNDKMYMRGVTAIEPEWLPKFGSSLQ